MSKSKKQQQKKSSSTGKIAGIVLLVAFVSILAYYFMNQPKDEQTNYNQQKTTMNNDYTFSKGGELVFSTANGDSLAKIDIEFAETNDKRTLGLMYRKEMEENQGMLFIFPYEEPQSFWMANTILPLDIIFVNSKRAIVKIHKNTTPYSHQSYPSVEPSIFVVEVNAGFTDRHNIKEGDKIFWMRTK